MMMESSEPNEIVRRIDQGVKATADILVPVMRRFTLDFHPEEAALGEEYSVTIEVLHDPEIFGSAPFLPLRLTMGSDENTDLFSRCFDVIKAGYITAKEELVIDRQDGAGKSADRCLQIMRVHWFDAVDPFGQVEEAITPDP